MDKFNKILSMLQKNNTPTNKIINITLRCHYISENNKLLIRKWRNFIESDKLGRWHCPLYVTSSWSKLKAFTIHLNVDADLGVFDSTIDSDIL